MGAGGGPPGAKVGAARHVCGGWSGSRKVSRRGQGGLDVVASVVCDPGHGRPLQSFSLDLLPSPLPADLDHELDSAFMPLPAHVGGDARFPAASAPTAPDPMGFSDSEVRASDVPQKPALTLPRRVQGGRLQGERHGQVLSGFVPVSV